MDDAAPAHFMDDGGGDGPAGFDDDDDDGKRDLRNGPIGRGERVYTYGTDQSNEGRGYIPTERTNRTRGEGTYLPNGPIGRGER
eukprot:2285336-Pyramimonas_sp.AAC.1